MVLQAAAPGPAAAAASSQGTASDLNTAMKQRGRRNSTVTAADVVDLVSDSDADADAEQPPAQPSRRRSKGRAAAAAAAAAIAGSTQAIAARDAPADDEFIDSDFELDEETQPLQPKQQQRAAAGAGRKRTLPVAQPVLGALKGPKSGLGVGSGAATAAAAGGAAKASAQGPAAKRAKTGAAAAGVGVKGGSKAPSGAGSRAAPSKQAAAKVPDACGMPTAHASL